MSVDLTKGGTRKGCPTCKTDDRLFSLERAEVMHPVRFVDGEMDYTGEDRIVLDESTEYRNRLYCRGCDSEFPEQRLVVIESGE